MSEFDEDSKMFSREMQKDNRKEDTSEDLEQTRTTAADVSSSFISAPPKDVRKSFAAPLLGMDVQEINAMEWEGNLDDFPMKSFSIPMKNGTKILTNPVVLILSTVFLWGLSIVCMVYPQDASQLLTAGRASITSMFTWMYVGANQFAIMIFILYTAVRYGHIKLGTKQSLPEFSDVEYFAMLFSAGVGVGLFFYGVSEPLIHQTGNYFANADPSQDERDMFALNLTIFHWGMTGWTQYLAVALCCGLVNFRFQLPMTLRSCFYPLLGEYVWGYIGDCIDALAVVATITGVCTSLGLGAIQLATGLERVGIIDRDQTEAERDRVLIIEIWVITAFATCSVVSGLGAGIKYLSMLGLAMGVMLQVTVFCLDKTSFLLNVMVQEVGMYISTSLVTLNLHTDPFGQLHEGLGRATDGMAADENWMNTWTIFYTGWWVSWSAFVGLFIGRISKGRTIRNVVFHSYAIPLGYSIMWFGVFGGVGLRQSRQAEELKVLGADLYGNSSHFLADDGGGFCYDVPQEDVVAPNGTVVFENELIGVTPVCGLNPADTEMSWFDVMYSYSYPLDFSGGGFGPFLACFSLISLTIYFVTSSDSGSLVVDTIASNGYPDTHWSQRVYWAITEGALATALLSTGGKDGLNAVQAASIITGLPFSFLLCFMCVSTNRMCQIAEADDRLEDGAPIKSLKEQYHATRTFKQPVFGGVLNVIEYALMCGCSMHEERQKCMPFPSMQDFLNFVIASAVPGVPYYKIVSAIKPKPSDRKSNIIMTCLHSITFYSWIVFFGCFSRISNGFIGFACAAWMINALILTLLRSSVRGIFNIDGNPFWDLICGLFFWPQVFCQLLLEIQDYDSHTSYGGKLRHSNQYKWRPDSKRRKAPSAQNVPRHEDSYGEVEA